MHKQRQAFTLVELIVVITILAILGTIAIMAFSGYSKNARDSARISDLSNIKKALELWMLQSGTYPEPSDASNIEYSGGLVWTQGTFGESVYNTVGKLDKKPKDPLYDVDYTYSVTQSKKEYQIGAVLEGQLASIGETGLTQVIGRPVSNAIIPQTYAATEAKAYILGTYNGILATTNTSPMYILALPSIVLSDIGDVNLESTNISLSYPGKDNLPSSYNETSLTMTGGNFTFNPIEVWSGTTLTELNDQTEFQVLVANLQEAYKSDTSFSNLPEYTSIANTNDFSLEAMSSIKALIETNTSQELTNVATTPVFNDCDFNGTTVLNGNNVTAYSTGSVAYGVSCSTVSEQRTCNNAVLSGSFAFTGCTVAGAVGTFTLSPSSVTVGGTATISNNCSAPPTSYTSSTPSVATISGTTITTLTAGTTNITQNGGDCGDNTAKTLTVNPFVCGTSTVSAGGNTYTTILGPDGKCWTSTNMKHTPLAGASTNTHCYDNNSSNCTTYGRLYSWYAAMGLPEGSSSETEDTTKSVCGQLGGTWKLPTDAQWTNLTNAGATGWLGNKLLGVVSNLPGYYDSSNAFYSLGSQGMWRSNTLYGAGTPWVRKLNSGNSTVTRDQLGAVHRLSIVCIKN